jgi:MFS family permease
MRRASSQRALAAGLIMAVTLNAFEAVAVVTAMPAISEELDGDRLYGAAFSAYMLASLVALVVSGEQADRRGPAVPFLSAVGIFASGLVVAGLAPSMIVVLVGRILQGAGAGALASVAYVGIGRAWSREEQPRLFALLSTAWVVPSLVAPVAAGWITEQFGWRWVFLGLLPLVPVLLLLAARPLVALGPPSSSERRMTTAGGSGDGEPVLEARWPFALRLAFGSGLVLAGLQSGSLVAAAALLAPGVALAGPALVRLLPDGTLQARPGIPAAVASRLCVNIAFFGCDTFVPLAATRLHGASALVAGSVILGGSVVWTVGAVFSARAGWPAPRAARLGFATLAAGTAGTVLVTMTAVPLWVTFLTCAVSGFGIGVVFNTTSVTAMGQAPAGREGLVGSQLGVADALGFAAIGAVGGALVGAADRGVLELGPALALVFLLASAIALVGASLAPRVRAATT